MAEATVEEKTYNEPAPEVLAATGIVVAGPDKAEPAVEELNARLVELFKKLNIERIVLVDDRAERDVNAGTVNRIIIENPAAPAQLGAVFPDLQLNTTNEALFDQLSAAIERFDAQAMDRLRIALAELSDEEAEREKLSRLEYLAPEGVTVVRLTPHAWHERRAEFIAGCTSEKRTFFLFDQQLEVDDAELPFRKGSDIIKDIAMEDTSGFGARWFCGMLTHTVSKGDEVAAWRALEREEDINLRFFMPIAKDSLDDRPAFYGSVYRALINTYCETMKALATEAFKSALKDALESFVVIDPIDFEHAVVKSSEGEGVSELEMLIRLYGVIQRDKVKSHILKDATLNDFIGAARSVRDIANIARSLPQGSQERLFKLRLEELYEPADIVNGHHDPLRNGDIFEIGPAGAAKLWVLIAQPCDLMVRNSGERAREDNFKVAVLAPIRTRLLGEVAEMSTSLQFSLDHLDHDGAQSAIVQFADATPANLKVLDLAVLDKLGRCQIEREFESPQLPAEAWQNRIDLLKVHYRKVTEQIEAARKNHKDAGAKLLADNIIPRVAPGKPLLKYGTYDNGKYVYEITRRGRVREPLANSLLSAFSRYLARDAYEHDFSRG